MLSSSCLKESPKMPCRDCSPPAEKSSRPRTDDEGLSGRAYQLFSTMLPEGSALLSSSCCWLPTLLDFIFAGSITAVGVQKLRFFFLAISVLTLSASIAREGFSRGNVRRAIICAGLLVWTQYSQRAQAHHSCH
ncbi:uncharacterized protein APUU_50038A [Aspergillus puulaauensis]|uniref:Uncharacterized protein n=1 Tax=Aspergillus puulaauensis TaxID=1220207 RepID=A0A7R7XPG8_9EURO|nr:uncharacterized protein APUU_50038A [Aspergillus puulaauensis]BCS25327.1 hypothetical protein APUU_50038A [Aspergillus puulaauensis]